MLKTSLPENVTSIHHIYVKILPVLYNNLEYIAIFYNVQCKNFLKAIQHTLLEISK